MKTITNILYLALALVAFACFAVLPAAQAVSPTPDGGYPGGNTAEGQNALFSLTTGGYNTAVGYFSLRSDTTGSYNTAVGAGALLANTGDQNTATGVGALLSNTTGRANTANGTFALFSNTIGGGNTAIGAEALAANTTGGDDTAIGVNALAANTSGNNNTAIGWGAGSNVTTANNVICIGAGVSGANVGPSCYIGGIYNEPAAGGSAVFVNSAGKLGVTNSSRRFKEEIKPMDKASEALLGLKPVTFHYKKEIDPTGASQFGLVAEDVEKVNPDLVVRDREGKPYQRALRGGERDVA
jgi:Chaperone of endosialidase